MLRTNLSQAGILPAEPPIPPDPDPPDEVPFPRIAAVQLSGWLNSGVEARLDRIAQSSWSILGLWKIWELEGFDLISLVDHIKTQNPDHKVFFYTNPPDATPAASEQETFVGNKVSSEAGPNGSPKDDWWLYNAADLNFGFWPENHTGDVDAAPNESWMINTSEAVTADTENTWKYPEWIANFHYAASTDVGDYVFDGGISGDKGIGFKEVSLDGVYTDNQVSRAFADLDWNGDGSNEIRDSAGVLAKQLAFYTKYRDVWKGLEPTWLHGGNMSRQGGTDWDVTEGTGWQDLNDFGQFEAMLGESWSVETWDTWNEMMEWYRRDMSLLNSNKLGMFDQHFTTIPGGIDEFQWMRYGLTSCLQDNGYYAAANPIGETIYGDYKIYDEYGVNLGLAIDIPQTSAWSLGVYRREFDNGLVLTNPKDNGPRTVNVGAGYKSFFGAQDSATNNGLNKSFVTLQERDGIILIRQ